MEVLISLVLFALMGYGIYRMVERARAKPKPRFPAPPGDGSDPSGPDPRDR